MVPPYELAILDGDLVFCLLGQVLRRAKVKVSSGLGQRGHETGLEARACCGGDWYRLGRIVNGYIYLNLIEDMMDNPPPGGGPVRAPPGSFKRLVGELFLCMVT